MCITVKDKNTEYTDKKTIVNGYIRKNMVFLIDKTVFLYLKNRNYIEKFKTFFILHTPIIFSKNKNINLLMQLISLYIFITCK